MNKPEPINPLPELKPLDVCLYFTNCLVDWVIAVKTYSMIGHVEITWTPGTSVAARSGGVNQYAFRREGLMRILRPNEPSDFQKAQEWFSKNAQGKRYNWAGLCSFDWPGDKQLTLWSKFEKDRWFCSELGCDILRAAGTRPFADNWPSIKVPPALFESSPAFDIIWSAN